MPPDLLRRLRAVLEAGPRLRLAVLFGSLATDRARGDSDADIAIDPVIDLTLGDETRLASALSGAAGREVDLVRLDHADVLLAREIARTGVPIVEEREGEFAAFRARAIGEWLDFDETVRPFRRRFLERLAGRGSAT